jgi:hypothetical protein
MPVSQCTTWRVQQSHKSTPAILCTLAIESRIREDLELTSSNLRRQTAKYTTVFVGKLSREAKADVVVASRVLRRGRRGEPETS